MIAELEMKINTHIGTPDAHNTGMMRSKPGVNKAKS